VRPGDADSRLRSQPGETIRYRTVLCQP
jgi:hypothetical protein